MILNLAETAVVKSRPSVPHGARQSRTGLILLVEAYYGNS